MTLYLDSVIPFGKHKGTQVSKLPNNYLQWLKDKTEHTVRYCKAPIVTKEVTVRKQEDFERYVMKAVTNENTHRRICQQVGRDLIYLDIQIPFD